MNNQLKFFLQAVAIFCTWVISLFILPFKVMEFVEWSIGYEIQDWGIAIALIWLMSIGLACAVSAAIIGDDIR